MRRRLQGAAPPRPVHLLIAVALAAVATLAAAAVATADPGDVVWRELSQRTPGAVDAFSSLAVSPSGALCAAGATASSAGASSDVLVRAYRPGGAVLWRRIWTWPGRSDDAAADIARDRRGGYVVAGSSGSGWLLLKYSAGGYLQWVRRGRGAFARASFAAVTIDEAGNVYAAGAATPSGSSGRLLLCKYSPAGAPRWRRTLASDAGDASAVALAAGGGDIYVAGRTATGEASSAALVVKYSAAGARRWTHEYAAAAGDTAVATGIAYAGGPVVCGWGQPGGGAAHGFVVRYDAAGERLWTGTSTVAGVSGERFTALAVDGAGRLCVAGSAVTATGDAALTACFDAGAQLWALTGAGSLESSVCRAGDGFAVAGGTAAFGVARLTSAGAPVWERPLAPAGYSDFRPAALLAAGDEYLYAVGSAAADGGGRAAVVVRYQP